MRPTLPMFLCAIFSMGCNVFLPLESVPPECPPITRSVDVTAAYLFADESDSPAEPLVIELAEVGLAAGDTLVFEVDGGYLPSRTGDPVREEMGAVFSASDELLDQDERDRVVDAIAAGTPVESRDTFRDEQPTDIPEDFLVEGATVVVPDDATHLFAAPIDSLFEDNLPIPDEPYDIRIACAAPDG